MIIPSKSSIGFSRFEKLTFLVEISKISNIFEKLQIHRGRRSCSTSYPSGNQVDGSPLVAIITRRAGVFPMESNTKTVAKRARVGPRTPVLLTMKMLFQNMFASIKCLVITIISLIYVLKLCIELIKSILFFLNQIITSSIV